MILRKIQNSKKYTRCFVFSSLFYHCLLIYHNEHQGFGAAVTPVRNGSHVNVNILRGGWSYYWPVPRFRAASAARKRGDGVRAHVVACGW